MNEKEISDVQYANMLLRLMRIKPELKERIMEHARGLVESFNF